MQTATASPTRTRTRCGAVVRSQHHARGENTEPVGSESGDAQNVLHSINIVSDLCLLNNYDTGTRIGTKSNRNSSQTARWITARECESALPPCPCMCGTAASSIFSNNFLFYLVQEWICDPILWHLFFTLCLPEPTPVLATGRVDFFAGTENTRAAAYARHGGPTPQRRFQLLQGRRTKFDSN